MIWTFKIVYFYFCPAVHTFLCIKILKHWALYFKVTQTFSTIIWLVRATMVYLNPLEFIWNDFAVFWKYYGSERFFFDILQEFGLKIKHKIDVCCTTILRWGSYQLCTKLYHMNTRNHSCIRVVNQCDLGDVARLYNQNEKKFDITCEPWIKNLAIDTSSKLDLVYQNKTVFLECLCCQRKMCYLLHIQLLTRLLPLSLSTSEKIPMTKKDK